MPKIVIGLGAGVVKGIGCNLHKLPTLIVVLLEWYLNISIISIV
jgi:hypothetical protein